MIVDEWGLTWRRTDTATGPRGEQCVRHDCVTHPRLFRLSQRASVDVEWTELYYVVGIDAQFWRTADEALRAMSENPK